MGLKNYQKRRRPERGRAGGRQRAGERIERGIVGYSRPPLARMLRLHECLMANRYPNCRKIAEEFEVSAKTVQRDVNFMRDRMGLPIEYEKARFGFRYTRAVTGFPAMDISAGSGGGSPWRQPAPPLEEHPAPAGRGRGGMAVRIRFDAESARAARGRTWHPTQVIHRLPGGGVEMTLRARGEWEIARWVLSWAGHAWVIEPQRLRSRVRQIAREIVARH